MTGFNIYQLILSLIVYLLLVILLGVVVYIVIKLTIKLINSGIEDYNIKKEYYDNLKKENSTKVKMSKITSRVSSLLFCCLIICFFIFSVVIKLKENSTVGSIPLPKVVASASMSKKHKENIYLFTNNLKNQFNTFDMIFLEKLPDEFDIKLYDVIMYQVDDTLVIHRVVKIEEPNSSHPNSRRFTFRGDAVDRSDKFQVTYEQMRGIYKGSRIPFVGSFVFFLQSPAGVMCLVLIVFVVIALPYVEKKINLAKKRRLIILGVILDYKIKGYVNVLIKKGFLKKKHILKKFKIRVIKNKHLKLKLKQKSYKIIPITKKDKKKKPKQEKL